MKRHTLTSLAVAAAFAWPVAAKACDSNAISLSLSPSSPVVKSAAYAPFDFDNGETNIVVTATNTGTGSCDFVLVFRHDSPSSPTHDGSVLPYDLVDTSDDTVLEASSVTGVNTALGLYASLAPSASTTWTVTVEYENGQLAPSGVYTTDLSPITVVAFEQGAATQVGSTQLRLSTSVAEQIILSLQGNVVAGKWAFGELQNGETQTIGVRVLSNEPYDISFTSREGGRLAHVTEPGWSVPYVAEYSSTSLGLTAPNVAVVLPNQPMSTNINGDAYPLKITIGDPSDQRAGDYDDELTILIETRP